MKPERNIFWLNIFTFSKHVLTLSAQHPSPLFLLGWPWISFEESFCVLLSFSVDHVGLHPGSRSAIRHTARSQTLGGLAHQCKPMSQGHNEWLVFNCMTHVFPIKVNQRSFSLQMNTLRSFLGSVFIVILLQKVLRGDLREGKCHFFFFLKAFLLSKVFLIATIEPSMGHQLLTLRFLLLWLWNWELCGWWKAFGW